MPDGHDNTLTQQKFDQEWETIKSILEKYRFDWQLMDPRDVRKKCFIFYSPIFDKTQVS